MITQDPRIKTKWTVIIFTRRWTVVTAYSDEMNEILDFIREEHSSSSDIQCVKIYDREQIEMEFNHALR